jgi:hypothetical protein
MKMIERLSVHAAVDEQHVAGDVARTRRRKKDEEARNIRLGFFARTTFLTLNLLGQAKR